MAKIDRGYMGGFSGSLGTAVGYVWNGKWCLRSRPSLVHNPRTVKQMAHRAMFRQQVQLAAHMRWGVNKGLTALAREVGMTAYNLFVSINQQAFSEVGGQLSVDWSQLQLSNGPVAPVSFGTPMVGDDNVLSVSFVKNPLHMRADNYDHVYLYVYCPELERDYLAMPVYRRQQRISVSLPDAFAGRELQVYGFVEDAQGRLSPTLYAGIATSTPAPEEQPAPASGVIHTSNTEQNINGLMDFAEGGRTELTESGRTELTEGGSTESAAEDARSNPMQLSLW